MSLTSNISLISDALSAKQIADRYINPAVVILSGFGGRRRKIVKLVEGSFRKDLHERMDALAVDHSAVRRVQPVC